MTKISLYSVDTNIQGNDKWIGSDAQNYNATKNFTPDKVAEYFNHNQIIDSGNSLRYTYQTLDPLEQRRPGTISFISDNNPEVNFSDITTFLLSKITLKGNDVSQYLNFLNGSKVVISKADNTNTFGFYKITNVEVYLPEPNFFNITLTYINGNGFIKEDLDYIISLVIDKYDNQPTHTSQLTNDGADGVHPFITAQDIPPSASTLQDVTTNGNTTTNDIVLNSTVGKYGDYTAQNTIEDLGVFTTLTSPTSENYTSYYAGYAFGINASYNTLSKFIGGYESTFELNSQDTSNSNYSGGLKLDATDNNGSAYIQLTNKLGNQGSFKVTDLTNNVILQFPNKNGIYTIATTDDVYTPTLQQIITAGNTYIGDLPIVVTNTDGNLSQINAGVISVGGQLGSTSYAAILDGGVFQSYDTSQGFLATYLSSGQLRLTNSSGYNFELQNFYITQNIILEAPNQSGTIALTSDIPSFSPSALTKTDDTNVTLTLGGSPSNALLQGVSLTLGWAGTLADSRIASASIWNAKQNAITLTTTGSGAATLIGNTLNIPTPSSSTFVSLTTTGSSGSSTLISGVLNVPTYTLSGLGGVSTSRTLTINGTTLDLTTNRSWSVGDLLSSGSYANPSWLTSLAYSKLTGTPTIPTVGTWGALNYPTWTSGTPFVKMTATGTFSLDTNTYLTSITSSNITTALGYTPVTNARTLTINGTTYDLTADRAWTIGSYTLPTATSSILGGVKVGSGVSVAVDGTISVSTNYQAPLSGTGFVKITGTTISYDNNTYVPYSSYGTNNISANNFFDGFTSIVASGTQIVLTVNSTPSYLVTGSGGQTIKLPDATTLPNGTDFYFNNNQSSGAISVNNNSNTLVKSVPSGGYLTITLIDNSTAAGNWDTHFQAPSNVSWSTNTFDYGGSITSATWNGVNVALNRGGTGASTASGARTNLGSTTVGDNFFTLTNPSAITFPRINADNTVSTLDAATFRSAIGAGTSSTTGTVTSVAALTLGTTGTDLSSSVATGTTTPVITLNVPTASATNRGVLSSTDWTTFNNKQVATSAGILSTLGYYNYKNTTPSSTLTGTLTETQLLQVTIPANTFSASDLLKIRSVFVKTGTTGNVNIRYRISNSNTMSTSSGQVATYTSVNSYNYIAFVRELFSIRGGNLYGLPFTAANQTDTGASNNTLSSMAIDVTQPIYVYVSAQLSSTTDSVYLNNIQITNM